MDLLKRSIAPILPKAWSMIDEEARRALGVHLCGRKLVEFKGPFGCAFAAVNIGRLTALTEQPAVGVSAGLVRVQPAMVIVSAKRRHSAGARHARFMLPGRALAGRAGTETRPIKYAIGSRGIVPKNRSAAVVPSVRVAR